MRDYVTALFVLSAALLVSGNSFAGIYKYLDENGKVVYGDKPVTGAKKMKIKLRPSPPPEQNDNDDDADGEGDGEDGQEVTNYDSLEMLSPRNDKIISDRTGSVQVVLMPYPRLSSAHKLIINVDGKDISRGRHTNLNLTGMSRGTHKVSARIIDSSGIEMIASPTSTFHVQRPKVDDDLAYK